MPLKYVAPDFMATAFTCPFCGAYSTVRWHPLYYQDHGGWGNSGYTRFCSPEPDAPQEAPDPAWDVSVCPACHGVAFWWDETMQYPREAAHSLEAPPTPEDMPQGARLLYQEASAVLPYSRRAAAALCRATLDVLTKELVPKDLGGLQLNGRLNHLASKVTTPTYQLLHVIRHVGNKSLHDGEATDDAVSRFLQDTDPSTAATYFRAIVDLVDELVTKPRLAMEAFAELPESVRRQIPESRSTGHGEC